MWPCTASKQTTIVFPEVFFSQIQQAGEVWKPTKGYFFRFLSVNCMTLEEFLHGWECMARYNNIFFPLAVIFSFQIQ